MGRRARAASLVCSCTKPLTQAKYPHFLVAPQASNSSYGFGDGVEGSATAPEHATHALVYGILDALSKEFNIDARRRPRLQSAHSCWQPT